MKLSIFGLGYIGCVSLGGFAEMGHTVIGFDIDQSKVDKVSQGKPTIVEKNLPELLARNSARIFATSDSDEAIDKSDLTFICVNTPGLSDGRLDLSQLESAVAQIARSVLKKNRPHKAIIRSTVPPGTHAHMLRHAKEILGDQKIELLDIVNNPEFLREGNAVEDFFKPGLVVFGLPNTNGTIEPWMEDLYRGVEGEIRVVHCKAAETIKFINNSWHALKVVFANEVGRLCHSNDVNAFEVMDLFCRDTKLNLSPYYLKPGFAFGGPCLTKDLRGCVQLGEDAGEDLPLLKAVEKSNDVHLMAAHRKITKLGHKKIAFLGVSFKPGTDDLRFSTKLELAKSLAADGAEVTVHDPNVSSAMKAGLHRELIERSLGTLASSISEDLEKTIADAELVVFSHNEPHYAELSQLIERHHLFFELSAYKGAIAGKRVGLMWP